jgi:hypothetical protein
METEIFIQQYFPMDIRSSRAELIVKLLRWCLNDLHYKEHGELIRQAENEVQAQLFSRMLANVQLTKKMEQELTKLAGSTAEHVISAFKKAATTYRARQLVLPPFDDEELTNQFKEAFSIYPLKDELLTARGSYHPSVEGAYACAVDGWHLTQTRLIAINAIKMLIAPRRYASLQLDGMSDLRVALWRHLQDQMFNVLLFGSLLGGKQAAEALELSASTCLFNEQTGTNFAVMHFLEQDLRSPGSWATDDEDVFRADIMSKLKERLNG